MWGEGLGRLLRFRSLLRASLHERDPAICCEWPPIDEEYRHVEVGAPEMFYDFAPLSIYECMTFSLLKVVFAQSYPYIYITTLRPNRNAGLVAYSEVSNWRAPHYMGTP